MRNFLFVLVGILLFIYSVSVSSFGFEYSIIGPSKVSNLKNIRYRVLIFSNDDKKLIPIKIYYKDKLIYQKMTAEGVNVNLDLSRFHESGNEIELNFRIDRTDNRVKVLYDRPMKAFVLTDKPLYQPGQTVYIKSVVFEDNKPSNSEVELVIQDPKSNTIFHKFIKLKGGAFFERFNLSTLVIHGKYSLVLRKGSTVLASTSFEVKKYTLPKFKIDFGFIKEPKILLVGDSYACRIDCSYFFGKKVNGAKVTVDFYSFDAGFNKIYSIEGVTNDQGIFNFNLKIPDYLTGIQANKAIVKIDIRVQDKAKQIEHLSKIFEVYKEPISAYVVPSNNPIVGLENKFYLVVSYANGKVGKFRVKFDKPFKKEFNLDSGFAEFSYKPTSNYEEFSFEVTDLYGTKKNFASVVYPSQEDGVLIFRDKASYLVGEKLVFDLYSSDSRWVYLDFYVRNEGSYRTVWSDSVFLQKGKKVPYSLTLQPDFKGVLALNVYFLNQRGNIVWNSKTFIVQDPSEVNIKVSKNKDVYRVRDRLEMDIVVDSKSKVFVDIVDEAVLYLSRTEPELLKLYLALEKELLEPKYEIHSIEGIILEKRDDLLKVLLDKSDLENLNYQYGHPIGLNVINTMEIKTKKTYKILEDLYRKCYNFYVSNLRYPESFRELGLVPSQYEDPWGTYIKIVLKRKDYIELRSAGMDRKFGTSDDIFYPGYVFTDGWFVRGGVVFGEFQQRFAVAKQSDESGRIRSDASKPEAYIVREYFPETFYSDLIEVDKSYRLSLTLPDSITNWKAIFWAFSESGKIGYKNVDITVFQKFFVDVNNPLYLTKGDEISLPIVVYNYTDKQLNVKIELELRDWFELLDDRVKSVTLQANSNSSVYFRIKAKKIGVHDLIVYASSGELKDAIKKAMEVIPDGFMVQDNRSLYVSSQYEGSFDIPASSIDGSSRAYICVYPSFSSQLLNGLDKLLAMPFGCFEQTSSINYPNVLILKYLRAKGVVNPSIEARAQYYIGIGYQRLLTFEVEGGGFSWFGDKPANKVLTAFGLMQFKDMKQVHFVDPNLIQRTVKFLFDNQNSDGSWEPDKNYIHQETWQNIQSKKLTVTCYILMSLLENDPNIWKVYESRIDKSLDFIYQGARGKYKELDNYTLGLILNILSYSKDRSKDYLDFGQDLIEYLVSKAVRQGGMCYWKGSVETLFFGYDKASDVETTSIIAMGMIRWNKLDIAFEAVKYLISSKDSRGIWYSTQPTIMALKAITNFDTVSKNLNQPNKVEIMVNEQVLSVNFSEDDLAYKIIDITSLLVKGKNFLKVKSKNPVIFDVNYSYYLPFQFYTPVYDLLDIVVEYDRKELKVNDKIVVKVRIMNRSNKVLNMVVVDLGIPPGFSVDLSKLRSNEKVKNVENTDRQVVVYFDRIDSGEKINLEYDIVSLYPLRVKIPQSKIYEYYNPELTVLKDGDVINVR
ncbi:MAG: alpha-2-macroglobulin family protein [bacterium]